MKSATTILLIFSFCLFLSTRAEAQDTISGYDFAWGDDFSGSSIDTSKWLVSNNANPTNDSLQDYLPSQVSVSGGNLVIKSENIASRGLPYRSGLVESTSYQKYGRWDVSAKLPTSKGMWPAIWLLSAAPWPSEGEIDIMENRGDSPHTTSSAVHWGENSPFNHEFLYQEQKAIHNDNLQNYHDSYHKYSVEWDPTQVRFYVDDVHHYTVRDSQTGGFLSNNAGEMRLIINTAIGGTFLDNPDDSTVWPQTLDVDYVHVYTKSAAGPKLTFENGGFESNGGSLAHWTTFGNVLPNVTSESNHVNEGSEALKMFGQFDGEINYSGIEQGISVTEGDEIIATAEGFVSSLDSIAGTNNSVEMKIDYYSELYGLFGSSNYLGSDSIILANGSTLNDAWLEYELNSVAPAGAVEARLAFVFIQPNNEGGAVWVDNVSFRAIPEPAGGLIVASIIAFASTRRRRHH